MNKKLLIIAIFAVLFFDCILEPSVQDITIRNASDNDVLNISLTYYHGTKGEQVKHIDALRSGDVKTLSVVTQDAALQTMVTSVSIEYYMNGIKFDSNNALGDVKYGSIGAGLDTEFIIENQGYHLAKEGSGF